MTSKDRFESTPSDGVELTEVLVDREGNLVGPLGTIKKVAEDRISFAPTKPTVVMVTDRNGRLLSRGPAGVVGENVDYILQTGDRVLIWQECGPLSPFMQLTT